MSVLTISIRDTRVAREKVSGTILTFNQMEMVDVLFLRSR